MRDQRCFLLRNLSREGLEGQKTIGEERDTELKSGVLCKSLQNDSKDNSIPKYDRTLSNHQTMIEEL